MKIHVFFLVLVCSVSASVEKDKRLVLHSDTDVVQEINKLRMELTNQKSEIQNLTTTLSDQKLKLNNISTEMNNQKTYFVSKLAEKDTKIQALESDQKLTVKNLTDKINTLRNEVTNQLTQIGGSTYVRWGRTSCPGNGTTLAYSGYMAGAKLDQTGGATNYLCLAGQPTWDYYEEGTNSNAQIYGVEYEFDPHNSASKTKFFGSDIHNDNAPCVVCHTTRSTSIMIPGRTICYGGWTKEYSGYLVTENSGYPHGTEYVCLDRRPEAAIGGKHNDDLNLLHLVDAQCGSIECPPYIQGREMACVVCSV